MRQGQDAEDRTVSHPRRIAEGMRSLPVEADVADEIDLGVDGQAVVPEKVDLHLEVPVAFLFLVTLDFQHLEIPPIGFHGAV